jgi:two-component system sensor histidine kinase HydH
VSISASGIVNEEGEALGVIYLLRDLREVKRLQAELRRSERLSTLGNMAARVAHEIRNPLSSIKGFATYLGARQGDEADREAARTMIGEVDRLNRVVAELLDFARPANLNIVDANLGDILERTVRLAETDARSGGVSLSLALQEGGDPALRVAVDVERITQAMLNLVLNAVQATDLGGAVTLTILPARADRAVIRVDDTGCGMAPEVLAQVFSPYFTTRATGTGLGLSIVAKIVEDHHGEIRMTSAPGSGTSVTLWLPLSLGGEETEGGGHA